LYGWSEMGRVRQITRAITALAAAVRRLQTSGQRSETMGPTSGEMPAEEEFRARYSSGTSASG
jgi:hypothetical protein